MKNTKEKVNIKLTKSAKVLFTQQFFGKASGCEPNLIPVVYRGSFPNTNLTYTSKL